MVWTQVAELGCTRSESTGVFQAFFCGKTSHPAMRGGTSAQAGPTAAMARKAKIRRLNSNGAPWWLNSECAAGHPWRDDFFPIVARKEKPGTRPGFSDRGQPAQ